MFNVPFLCTQIENWVDRKGEIEKVFLKFKESIYDHREGPVKTNYHYDRQSSVPEVSAILKPELDFFVQTFSLGGALINSAWFESASKNEWHPVHNHGALGYSAVCYVNFIENEHTGTKFVSPFNNFISGAQLTFTPDVKEGSIIFFPSSILHYTEPNTSETERIILSFNLVPKVTQ